jgi:predicted chitinase
MNIVGEGINPIISKQIKVRQKVYGSINRSIEQLEYLNSRTAFAKLVSSVNVTDKFNPTSSELKRILNEIRGNTLAKRFVLFNGTTNEDLNIQRAGIARDGSIINPNAYGLGGLEFGIRPMPGIVSATTKTENRGSLRTTTIQIKAWNRVQFEIIDLLYLRLGYSVLFEFGNTIYFNNNNSLIKDNPNSIADTFLVGDYTVSTLLKKIQEVRIASNGNYDAVFGKVVNFSWEFVEDGSYDITVIIRSVGDVIESLKTNVLISDSNEKPQAEEASAEETTAEETQETPTVESYADKHQIGRLLFNAKNALATAPNSVGGCRAIFSNLFKNIPQVKGKKHFLQQDYTGGESQYYIRLGSLLAFIENVVVPKYQTGDNAGEPILNFDYAPPTLVELPSGVTTTVYKDTNYIYTIPNQISMDPRVCLINTSITSGAGNQYLYASQGEPYVEEISGYKIGKVMNIYVNFMYILTTMDANLDKDNKVSLISFLTALLNGISNALGSINTLEPFIDEITNTVKIIDQSTLPGKYEILAALKRTKPDDTTILNLYGYYNRRKEGSSAGFVRNFGIKTEITPNLATMLSIGAQAAGSVVGEDATALSKLNEGLKDRVKNDVVDAIIKTEKTKSKTEELNERFPNANKNFSEASFQLGSLKGSTPTWDEERINSYSQLQSDFLAYLNAKQAIKSNKSSSTIGFIPVNLNLTLDGISGLKIYNALRIDTSYLPSNYPTSMDFIITGLNHTIQNNVWTTEINTNMVPRDPSQSAGGSYQGNSNSNSNGSSNPTPSPRGASRGTTGQISESKRRIVERIVDFARQQGINDRDRLIALITIAQAESGITPGKSESFLYSLDRAKAVFPSKLKGLTDEQILNIIPASKGGKGTEKTLADKLYSNLYGNGPGEGYKYAGKGMTQITFKGNYRKANENFKKYNLPYDLIANPGVLKTNEDADIALLVIGKLEGQFGNRLKAGVNYSGNPAAIIATQDGGKSVPSSAPLAVYSRALQTVLNTKWINDLIG